MTNQSFMSTKQHFKQSIELHDYLKDVIILSNKDLSLFANQDHEQTINADMAYEINKI